MNDERRWHVLLLIAAAVLQLAIVADAFAGMVEDLKQQRNVWCVWTTRTQVFGMAARIEGRPLVIKYATRKQLEQVKDAFPMDAIYILEDNGPYTLTPEDRQQLEWDVTLGWAKADAWVKQDPALLERLMALPLAKRTAVFEDAAKRLYAVCMEAKSL